jgi:hypothetical protein
MKIYLFITYFSIFETVGNFETVENFETKIADFEI